MIRRIKNVWGQKIKSTLKIFYKLLMFPVKDFASKMLIPSEKRLGIELYTSWITPDGLVYAGSRTSVYKSADQGRTWGCSLRTWGKAREIYGVFVSKSGSLFASPNGRWLSDADKGLWRSADDGKTWARVIDLSGIYNFICVWGISEDSQGRIFAGTYGNLSRIYRSEDSGLTWKIVYADTRGETHIHNIQVDEKNDYLYACHGDSAHAIIRSQDHGDTWEPILPSLPQMVGIGITPRYRLFGTDGGNIQGRIYRTADDKAAEIVLDTGMYIDNYWMRRDPLTGSIYAGFLDNGTASAHKTMIYVSKDEGASWVVVKTAPIKNAWDGFHCASNIVDSRLFYSFNYSGNIQKGRALDLRTRDV